MPPTTVSSPASLRFSSLARISRSHPWRLPEMEETDSLPIAAMLPVGPMSLRRLLPAGVPLRSRLHLDADPVDRLPRSVEDPAGWLGCHVDDQTPLTIPALDRLDDLPVGRQLGTIRRDVMNWPLDLIEHEDR